VQRFEQLCSVLIDVESDRRRLNLACAELHEMLTIGTASAANVTDDTQSRWLGSGWRSRLRWQGNACSTDRELPRS
jgi:hypothetical protein